MKSILKKNEAKPKKAHVKIWEDPNHHQTPRSNDHDDDMDHDTRLMQTLADDKLKALTEINENFTMEKLQRLSEDDHHNQRKRDSLQLIEAKIPLLARWYLRLSKVYVNQTLFIQNVNDANKIRQDAERGIHATECDLKQTMIKEIDIFIEK